MPYRFNPLSTSTPTDQLVNAINKNFATLDNEAVTKVFKSAGGINAFTLGQIKDLGVGLILRDSSDIPRIVCYINESGTPILKVSKDGFDATTTGNANLIFNSSQNVFKVITTNTYTFPATSCASGNTLQQLPVAHSLGTVPKVEIEIQRTKSPALPLIETSFPTTFYSSLVTNTGYADTDSNLESRYDYAVDTANLLINRVISNGSGGALTCDAITVRYYILQETAN